MREVTICFSRPKNHIFPIGSYAIRAYMSTGYSHVSYHFDSVKYNCTLVYEAVGSGIRFIEKENWLKSVEVVSSVTIQVNSDIYDKMMLVCIKNAGNKYGFKQNIGVVIADIFSLDYNPFPSYSNCSELLARILDQAGYKFNKGFDLITPKDIEITIMGTATL
jgi:hypothetical protein